VLCGNDPVNYVDLLGLCKEDFVTAEDLVYSVSDFCKSQLTYNYEVGNAAFERGDYFTSSLAAFNVAVYGVTDFFVPDNREGLGGLATGYFAALPFNTLLSAGRYVKKAGGTVGDDVGMGLTQSNLKLGQEMHKLYKADLNNPVKGLFKEYTGIKGIRPDFVDFNTKIIYELKPNNPRAIQEGIKQVNKYKQIFEQQFGGEWKTFIDTY